MSVWIVTCEFRCSVLSCCSQQWVSACRQQLLDKAPPSLARPLPTSMLTSKRSIRSNMCWDGHSCSCSPPPLIHWPTDRENTEETPHQICANFPTLPQMLSHFKLCAVVTTMGLMGWSAHWGQINTVTSSPSAVGKLAGSSESSGCSRTCILHWQYL